MAHLICNRDGVYPTTVMAQPGEILIRGAPSTGKSFVALDMAFHASNEWLTVGLQFQAGEVLYVDFAADPGLLARTAAWAQYYGDRYVAGFSVLPWRPDGHVLDGARAIAYVRDAIRSALGDEARLLTMVVLDLSGRVEAGADFWEAKRRLKREIGCTIVTVAHDTPDFEGWSADLWIDLERAPDGTPWHSSVVVENPWQEKRECYALQLKQVHLQGGEDQTSCVPHTWPWDRRYKIGL